MALSPRRMIPSLLPIILLVCIQFFYLSRLMKTTSHAGNYSQSNFRIDSTNSKHDLIDVRLQSCSALKAHEKGHWHHVSSNNISTSAIFYAAEVQQQFYSREKDWLRGLNLPPSFNNTQCAAGTEPGEYYLTGIGNQCGCGNGRFHPTYSSWIANDATLISNSKSEQLQEHSSASNIVQD